MLHLYRISENTGKYSSDEHMVIASSMDEAKAMVLAEIPDAKLSKTFCRDWGEVTPGLKGTITTGD
jgi:hypothetical protein